MYIMLYNYDILNLNQDSNTGNRTHLSEILLALKQEVPPPPPPPYLTAVDGGGGLNVSDVLQYINNQIS